MSYSYSSESQVSIYLEQVPKLIIDVPHLENSNRQTNYKNCIPRDKHILICSVLIIALLFILMIIGMGLNDKLLIMVGGFGALGVAFILCVVGLISWIIGY